MSEHVWDCAILGAGPVLTITGRGAQGDRNKDHKDESHGTKTASGRLRVPRAPYLTTVLDNACDIGVTCGAAETAPDLVTAGRSC